MQKTMEAINIVNFKDTINVRFEQIRLCPHCNVHATVSTIDSDLEVINAQQLLNK